MVDEINNISKLYGQGKGANNARSINIEDINKITGYNPETANYQQGKYIFVHLFPVWFSYSVLKSFYSM